jgi:hypothetical protein
MPLRIIPDRGQGSENGIQPSRKQRSDVLHEDKPWFQFANETGVSEPKAATLTRKAGSLSCETDVLAWEAAADCINGNSVCGETFAGKRFNVIVTGNLRPMLLQNLLREWLDLAERDGLESACALKAKVEAANAREEREDAQRGHCCPSITKTTRAFLTGSA